MVDLEDLEGPKIDRRTTLTLLKSAGLAGVASSLSGCSGGGGSQNNSNAATNNSQSSSSSSSSSSSKKMGGEIKAGLLTDAVQNLDPHRVGITHQIKVMQNIFNGIVRLNHKAEIVGDLASDWSIPDSTTYVFHIVDGATFQNGEPCDAQAIKWSLNRLKGMKTSQHVGKVSGITDMKVAGNKLTIKLKKPEAPFISYMTCGPGRAGAVVPKKAKKSPDEFNTNPIGTGPFRLTDRASGESITLKRYKDYWEKDDNGNQLPYIDKITVDFIPEESTMWTSIQNQEIDLASRIGGQFGKQAKSNPKLAVSSKSTAHWTALRMMTNNPAEHPKYAKIASRGNLDPVPDLGDDIPTSDIRVRQAVSKALDRKELAQKGYFGFAIPAHQLYNPVTFMYKKNPDTGQFHDPKKAKQLLDEAGYTGNPRFSAKMTTEPSYKRLATTIKGQLSNVGIKVTLNILQPSVYYSSDGVRAFDTIFGIATGASDIDPWMSHWRQLGIPSEISGKGGGTIGTEKYNLWSNKKFNDLIIQDSKTADQDKRRKLLSKAMKIFVKQSPWAMAVFETPPKVQNKNLKDVGLQAGLMSMRRAYLSS